MSARDRFPAVVAKAFYSEAHAAKYGPPAPASFITEAGRLLDEHDALCAHVDQLAYFLDYEHGDCGPGACVIRTAIVAARAVSGGTQ